MNRHLTSHFRGRPVADVDFFVKRLSQDMENCQWCTNRKMLGDSNEYGVPRFASLNRFSMMKTRIKPMVDSASQQRAVVSTHVRLINV